MRLSSLLKALSSNTDLKITLLDDNDRQIVTFNAAGFSAVGSDLGNRDVKRIKIVSRTDVYISVEDTDTPESDPIPDSEPDNTNTNNTSTDPETPANTDPEPNTGDDTNNG